MAGDPIQVAVWPPPLETVTLIYNTGDCGSKDVSITLRVPSNITGQTVMEIAANQDEKFQFTSKYFNNTLGYSLQEIGGKQAGKDSYWKLSVGTLAYPPYTTSPVGYSSWYPFDGSVMRWDFTKIESSNERWYALLMSAVILFLFSHSAK